MTTPRTKMVACVRGILAAVILGLFVKACLLPVLWEPNALAGDPGEIGGLGALVFGWTEANGLVPWLANPLWLVGMILLVVGSTRLASLVATLAVFCGLSTLYFYRCSYLLDGYVWWLACLATLAIGSLGVTLFSPPRTIPANQAT